ncbi:SRPBCC domain-containing protein [Paenibacillus silvae]|uniref:SRPBCC domain-containing protein n=1 Tax=Paenibacillus silvae TaxID=1325358 RepID=UPI002002D11B|nr:SRPBCC domain-containing protein [Paenibacillus silvae]MCK6077528.1 SRPBCC domain-containing protein [Paenibacillus silvae]MCK6151740.1 SRPBCC domain-containing protein [Paenibacillus silvae]MCK6270226.1 SRPBCC domain-containing protein [Paenibacillus silvae]
MKQIRTEILINMPAHKVWEVLTHFEAYPDWNPFMVFLKGKVEEGAKIEVKMVPPGSKGMIFKPKVLKFQQNKEFRWLGHTMFPGLFDGEHIFELVDHQNGTTTLIQRENFRGILVPLLQKSLDKGTKAGFEAMNKKLKQVCESL